MNFDDYQNAASKTAVYPNQGDNLTYPALGLAGEAGEVAEKVKKIIRDDGGELTPSRISSLEKELGDVLWYVAAMCHEIGVTMEQVAMKNVVKLQDRVARGAIKGSGDDR
jgi:NTP pyrophosphatase (non-canonical NTP hydrolase)